MKHRLLANRDSVRYAGTSDVKLLDRKPIAGEDWRLKVRAHETHPTNLLCPFSCQSDRAWHRHSCKRTLSSYPQRTTVLPGLSLVGQVGVDTICNARSTTCPSKSLVPRQKHRDVSTARVPLLWTRGPRERPRRAPSHPPTISGVLNTTGQYSCPPATVYRPTHA